MKLASFDIEISKEIPVGTKNFRDFAPYGIACAALALEQGDDCEIIYWSGVPQMSQSNCDEMLDVLFNIVDEEGYTLVTWNGCKFDLFALAQESGAHEDCVELTLIHIDLMLQFTFTVGHYLGLEKALLGAGLAGKVHDIVLSNGKELHDMHGSKAPQLWKQGEYDAVLEYLRGDVVQLLALAKWVQRNKQICWLSSAGNEKQVPIPKLLTVDQCFDLPLPDTSWMTNSPTRKSFVDWILDPGLLE